MPSTVYKDYLLAKLQTAGVGACFLNFLDPYLQPRKAIVAVEGVTSEEFEIANTVFQGTVLGPPLWNVFFSDVTQPASSTGGIPSLFADDLSDFKNSTDVHRIPRSFEQCIFAVIECMRGDELTE